MPRGAVTVTADGILVLEEAGGVLVLAGTLTEGVIAGATADDAGERGLVNSDETSIFFLVPPFKRCNCNREDADIVMRLPPLPAALFALPGFEGKAVVAVY